MNTAKTFDIADAVVARGLRAWTDEQLSVTASRERWKLIGEALKIGREANAGNQAFGAWCVEHGFGDMDRRVRADALRVDWSVVQRLDNDVSHPTRIRQAHRRSQGQHEDDSGVRLTEGRACLSFAENFPEGNSKVGVRRSPRAPPRCPTVTGRGATSIGTHLR